MTVNNRAIAGAVLWGSAGFNVAVMLSSVWRHEIAVAAVQSVLVVILAAWLALRPKLDAWLDARLAEANAQRDTAQLLFKEVERLQRDGQLQLGVTASVSKRPRVN